MLLSVGGNISAIGNKFEDEKWKVGIQNPDKGIKGEDDVLESVYLSDMSLVTSGDYQRYFTVDGKRYNHIIDPDTLMPADHFRAVTILCSDSGLADGLSTATFLMGMDSGKKLIQSVPNTEAVYVMPDGSTIHIK